MRIAPSLALILSIAACEHASNATSPSTLPELNPNGPTEPAPTTAATPAPDPAPAPAPTPEPTTPEPAAAMVKPTAPAPTAPAAVVPPEKTVKPLMIDCERQRQTRAAPKWRPECDGPRVTKKPAPTTASPKAGDAGAAKP